MWGARIMDAQRMWAVAWRRLGACAVLALAGCGGGGGGGGGSGSVGGASLATGNLVDAPVAGVSYQTSSGLSGMTGIDGSFSYKSGDTVTFTVLGVTLGRSVTVPGNGVVTPLSITGEDPTGATPTLANAPNATALAQFLQTLGQVGGSASGNLIMPVTDSSLQRQLAGLYAGGGLGGVVNGLQAALSNSGIGGITVVTPSTALSNMNLAIQAVTSAAGNAQFANSTWVATGSGGGATIELLGNGMVEGLTSSGKAIFGTWIVASGTLSIQVSGVGGGSATATLSQADLAASPPACGACVAVTPANGSPWTGSIAETAAGTSNPYSGIWFGMFTPNGSAIANNMHGGAVVFIAESNGSITGAIVGSGGGAISGGSWNSSNGSISLQLSGGSGSGGQSMDVTGSLATQTATLSIGGTVMGTVAFTRSSGVVDLSAPVSIQWSNTFTGAGGSPPNGCGDCNPGIIVSFPASGISAEQSFTNPFNNGSGGSPGQGSPTSLSGTLEGIAPMPSAAGISYAVSIASGGGTATSQPASDACSVTSGASGVLQPGQSTLAQIVVTCNN